MTTGDDAIFQAAIQIERGQIKHLDDGDLQSLLTETRREQVMALEADIPEWIQTHLAARERACTDELNWRARAQRKGGPVVNKRDWSDRIKAVKLEKSIAEVVAISGVELKKQGDAYVGRCPFHDDRTPSFNCWQESGRWRCYGCGMYGDAIDYVCQWQGVDMKMAVQFLEGRRC